MTEPLRQLHGHSQSYYDNRLIEDKSKIIPFCAFLDQLISNIKSYLVSKTDTKGALSHQSTEAENWAAFLLSTTSPKIFNNIYFSWKKYCKTSLEAQLISTFLYIPWKLRGKINTFLKLKRQCTKSYSGKNLDEIAMGHEDIIGVVHNVYSRNDDRKQIISGIKQLFISYKIIDAKIYSCVFIEYALSLFQEQNQRYNEEFIIKNRVPNEHNRLKSENSIYSSVQPQDNQFYSSIHQQNGLYRKNKTNSISFPGLSGYQIIDRKFVHPKIESPSKKNTKEGRMSKKNMAAEIRIEEGVSDRPFSEIQVENRKSKQSSLISKKQQKSISSKNRNYKNTYSEHYDAIYQRQIPEPEAQPQQLSPSARQIILSKYSPKHEFLKSRDPQPYTNHLYDPVNDYYEEEFTPEDRMLLNIPDAQYEQQQDSHQRYYKEPFQSRRKPTGQSQHEQDIHEKTTEMKKKPVQTLNEEQLSKIVIHQLSGAKSKRKKYTTPKQGQDDELIYSEEKQIGQSINDSPVRKNLFKKSLENNSPEFEFDLQEVPNNNANTDSVIQNQKGERVDKYESWNKMVEHNEKFKQRMLQNSYNTKGQSGQNPKENVHVIRTGIPKPKGRHYNCYNS